MAAASFPTSVRAALPNDKKSRLVQIIMLFLHRVSMTFALRTFFRNPMPLERTREMMIWSSSFPAPNVRQISWLVKKLFTLERIHVEALVFPRKLCRLQFPFYRSPLCIIRSDNLVCLFLVKEPTGKLNDDVYLLLVLMQGEPTCCDSEGGMANRPAISLLNLLTPFDMQETTCCLALYLVYGLQFIIIYMTGNEFPDDDWHAVCVMELGRSEEQRS